MAGLRTTVIMKTDIVDSTPRTAGQTQSEMGLERKHHRQFIADVAARNSGSIFHEEGDAYWIEFPSVTTAAVSAMEMHQSLRSTQIGKGEKQRLAMRAVITVGDILHQERDMIGTTMSLTARIEKITPPDDIYFSHAAWLVLNKAEVQTSYVGEFNFKGFNEPEKVYKVDQKHRTRVLTDHYIVYTDANRFEHFIKSAGTEAIEQFLLDCDDLINEMCDKHAGTIRQVNGDECFFTFLDANQTIRAVAELCHSWKRMVARHGLGISIGVHKGDLNMIRSYVFGDDIQTTVYLTRLAKLYHPGQDEIRVMTSRKIRDELQGTKWEGNFRKLDPSLIVEEADKTIVAEHGAFEFIGDDNRQKRRPTPGKVYNRGMKSFRKYWAIFQITLINSLAYPGELVGRSLMIVPFMWIFYQLWKVTFSAAGSDVINGMTLYSTMWYLMMAETIELSRPALARTISENVKDGSIAYLLNKPYSFLLYQFSNSLGETIFRALVNALMGSVMVWWLVGPPPGPVGWLFAFVAVFGTWVLNFCITCLIGLSAFLVEEVSPFVWIYQKLIFILGGFLIPLDFYPEWLQAIAKALPFSAMIYGPSKLFVSPTLELFTNVMLMQSLWILALGTILVVSYRRGVAYLTVNGG